MPYNITVDYEEYEDALVPVRMILTYPYGSIEWDKAQYIPLTAPFHCQRADAWHEEAIGVTITQGDMVLDPGRPTELGIYFPRVLERIEKSITADLIRMKRQRSDHHQFDYDCVTQLIIYVADIEEIMQMHIYHYFEWRK